MDSGRDPVQRGAEADRDLQEVATWEPRAAVDRFATTVSASLRPIARAAVVLVAAVLLFGLLASGLTVAVTHPTLRVLVALSVVPALLLVVYAEAGEDDRPVARTEFDPD